MRLIDADALMEVLRGENGGSRWGISPLIGQGMLNDPSECCIAETGEGTLPENRKGVVTQAIFRGNMALYALPLAESVLGDAGKLSATVAVAVSVPLFNILAIIVLEYYTDRKTGVWSLIKKVFTNPLLIGSFVGLIFMILKIRLPSFIVKPVSAISSATTTLALMTLGGTLHFSSLKKDKKLPVL